METIELNKILNREHLSREINNTLKHIIQDKSITTKRGIFIHGESGVGKSTFIMNLLKDKYDVIFYDGSDARTRASIETIADNTISQYNVSNLLNGVKKQIVVVMDDIESMNTGDKGGINSLIKLIRPKKTKRQKLELKIVNPIICISNVIVDKKIKELMKVCNVYKLETPTTDEMKTIYKTITKKNIDNADLINMNGSLRNMSISLNNNIRIQKYTMVENYDVKNIVYNILNSAIKFIEHDDIINDTHRTIVGLIYHENLATVINEYPKQEKGIKLYANLLENICYSDYLDRITFQKQIWQFNEISSLLKTMKTNGELHKEIENPCQYIKNKEINFTKILTKYSTEYNNSTFFQQLSYKLLMEYDLLIRYFKYIRPNIDDYYEILKLYDIYDIDITRIYKYIDNIENFNEKNMTEVNGDICDFLVDF